MANSFERSFNVNPEGEAEQVKEKVGKTIEGPRNKNIIGAANDRKFVVGESGDAVIEGDNKEKLAVKRSDSSVKEFINLSHDVEPSAEISPEQKATIEAMDRLSDIGDPRNLINFTPNKSSKELVDYFEKNKNNLNPEEKFYLQTTIAFRKQQGR